MSVDSIISLVDRFAVPILAYFACYYFIYDIPLSVVVLCGVGLLLKFFQRYERNYNLPEIRQPLAYKDVVVITGGSQGLGREIVKVLVGKYNVKKVFVLDIIPIESSEKITYCKCDVGSKEDLKRQLEAINGECFKAGDTVSVFINNAGIRHSTGLIDTDDGLIERLFDVNVFSFIWASKLVIKNHIDNVLSINPDQRLSVVTISSVLGFLAPKNLSVYSATKAALTQAHEGLTVELKDQPSIRPLLVLPGQLSVGMFSDVQASRQFFAPIVDTAALAEEIAERIDSGKIGTLTRPFYGNFLPLVKTLPFSLVDLCRWFSQMDYKIKPKAD